MKIAYYEENNYHTEIMGTFLEPFIQGNNIIVYNDGDKSQYIEMFSKKISFEIKKTDMLLEEINTLDIIIIGTSESFKFINNDKIDLSGSKPKIFFINHLKQDAIKFNKYNGFVLTPINLMENLNYILPINNFYHGYIKTYDKIRICIIGRFKDSNRDINDICNLVMNYPNLNYEIIIYTRHKKFIPKEIFKLSNLYCDKIKIHLKVPILKIIESMDKINYFCPLTSTNSCYTEDRLTGIIPFSFNYNTPLLLDEKTNQIYNLKSPIIYKKSLCEIIHSLCSKSIREYNLIINDTIQEKNKINNNNINFLKKIYDITNESS
jgi:hypothetical protein